MTWGTWEKQESPTSRDVFFFCRFCTRDFRAPLIRLGDGSLLPSVGLGRTHGLIGCMKCLSLGGTATLALAEVSENLDEVQPCTGGVVGIP